MPELMQTQLGHKVIQASCIYDALSKFNSPLYTGIFFYIILINLLLSSYTIYSQMMYTDFG